MEPIDSFSNSDCADPMGLAERELSAFVGAVAELFGPAQARLSAQDWIEESQSMIELAEFMPRDWRTITIAASVRLARWVNVSLPHPMSSTASTTDRKKSPIPLSNCFN